MNLRRRLAMMVTKLFKDNPFVKGFVLTCIAGLWFSLGFFGLLENIFLIFFGILMTAMSLVMVLPLQHSSVRIGALYLLILVPAGAFLYPCVSMIDLSSPQCYIPAFFVLGLLVMLGVLINITPRFPKYKVEVDDYPIFDSSGAEIV